ncbi:MAG: hypothetical protein Q4E46_03415 [Candidatus Saccharibacteria bacterium]|nr:hypothetical protein [Candidatus Saccharibacteria bacterium]
MKRLIALTVVLLIGLGAVGAIAFMPPKTETVAADEADITLASGNEILPDSTAVETEEMTTEAASAVPAMTMEEVVQTLDLPKTLEEIEPASWLGNFLTQLAQAKQDGQTWVDRFSIQNENGKLVAKFRPASLKSESETRVRSSITEGRRPKDVISNAPEYALPKEIGTNHTYAKLYIQCVILTNPLEALQLADYLNDVKFNENDTTLGTHLSWLTDYLKYMNAAYKNVDRKDLTGQIYPEWVAAGKAPRGLEVTLDPNCEYISSEVNAQTGRVDQATVAIGLCEVLDAFDREFVTDVTADWFYELLPFESASLLRATRCNKSETGDWVRFQFQDPKSNRVLFVVLFNVGDLRVGHPGVVQQPAPTATPTKTTPAPDKTSDSTPTPKPSKDESQKPDEQGNAPVGGGSNDDPGPGPYEPEPTVPKSDSTDVQQSQYQPQADPDRTHDSHDSSPENTQGHVGPSDSEVQAPGTSSTVTETHQDNTGTTTTTTTTTGHTEDNGGHTQDVVTETTHTDTSGNTTTTLEQIDNENIATRPVEAEQNTAAGSANQNVAEDNGNDTPDWLPD